MVARRLGSTGLLISPIGYGAFKIGRNVGIKYPEGYELPDERDVECLLNAVLDMGINYIDTAPAYGLSEERIGRALAHRRDEFVLSTKVGESFENSRSTYDYSRDAVIASVERSLKRLRTDVLDLVFIHSDGRIETSTNQRDETSGCSAEIAECVSTLLQLRDRGLTRFIGLSGKTVEGARAALDWADAIMVEYHLEDRSHGNVVHEASERGAGVIVKKGLASGHLAAGPDAAAGAIQFVMSNPAVSSLVIGGLNLEHIRANIAAASSV